MDRMLYVAMTGAKETLRAQTVNNHNLANASTTGFRAELAAFQSRAVDGSGYASRVYATNASDGLGRTSPARCSSTGRDLDVAINGDGWIAVQGADGSEAYTRAGDLQVDADRPADHRHGPSGARRRRPDQRAAVHLHLLRARRIDLASWRRARRPTPPRPSAASSWSIRRGGRSSAATTACSA